MNSKNRKTIHAAMVIPLMLAGGFGGFPGLGGPRSAASVRHDPKRPKTEEDLERMEAARLKRERKAAKKQAQVCQCCGRTGAKRRRQNTAYHNDEQNFATLCPMCQEMQDEHWAEMWRECYSSVL